MHVVAGEWTMSTVKKELLLILAVNDDETDRVLKSVGNVRYYKL